MTDQTQPATLILFLESKDDRGLQWDRKEFPFVIPVQDRQPDIIQCEIEALLEVAQFLSDSRRAWTLIREWPDPYFDSSQLSQVVLAGSDGKDTFWYVHSYRTPNWNEVWDRLCQGESDAISEMKEIIFKEQEERRLAQWRIDKANGIYG